ncbi:MAG: helix-turn-helix domain-containing protein [Phreatobacter sp.]|uniref:helix-turn-helix domain-containing protein n=1 Tax=Phreatobacter sp. TaxID=1966341 RepID=UPI004036F7E8
MPIRGATDGPPGPLEERAREVREAFAARYREYQYRFVEFLTEHLSDLSRAFGGDLQAMLVLAIVGQVRIASLAHAGADGDQEERGAITASRLADVTGIPRETVRRKLTFLAERGWIERTPGRSWRLVVREEEAVARQDLSDLDQRAIHRIARLFAGLEVLVVPDSRQGRRPKA